MVTSGRNPFEIILILAALLAGLTGLLVPGSGSGLIQRLLADWEVVWNVGLTVGAATAALSLVLKPPMTLLIERVGMTWLAALMIPFGAAVYVLSDNPASTGAFLIAGYGVACAARVAQITHQLARLRMDLRRAGGRQ